MIRCSPRIIVTAALLLSGCAALTPRGTEALSAAETAIRGSIDDAYAAKVLFIAFGSDARGNPIDPPPGFVSRFADLPKPVKPASGADYHERVVGDRLTGIRDLATRQRGWRYSVVAIRRTRLHSYEIELDSSGGGLSGGRFYVTVTRRADGRWSPEASRHKYIY